MLANCQMFLCTLLYVIIIPFSQTDVVWRDRGLATLGDLYINIYLTSLTQTSFASFKEGTMSKTEFQMMKPCQRVAHFTSS